MKPCLLTLLLSILLSWNLHAAEPITLGGTLALTGKYAPIPEIIAKGLTLWSEQVNARGGLLGRQVKLIIHDDTSRPEVARRYYEKLILEDKVDLVFGPFSSTITAEILKVTEPNGYPVLTAGAASDQLWQRGYTHLFGVYIPASRYGFGFLKFCLRHNLTKVAVVGADDMFCETVADGAVKWARRLGMEVVLDRRFVKGTKDLDGLAQEIRDAGAEAIVVGSHFAESVDVRRALKNINWYPRAYFATLGPSLQQYYDLLGKDAEKTFTLSNWEPEGVFFEGSLKFANDFKKKYNIVPSYQAAAGFSVGQILEAAVRKTGSLDRKKLRDALATLDTMTIMGRYGVDATGQQVRHFSLLMQWQQGRQRIVGPTGMKSIHVAPAILD